MVDAGVRMFSDDGRCVPNARLLRNALTYVRAFDGVVIAEHCEDGSLAEGGQMHEGLISASLGLAGQPREAEEVVVARDLAIARLTGGRLHLCHLSSAGSVEMLRRVQERHGVGSIPVVMFSGQLDAGSEAAQRGAQGFVGKPFDLRALIDQTKQIVPA